MTTLEELDFTEDLTLLCHSHQQMQEKTSEIAAISSRMGLNVNKDKTKILKVNAVSVEPVKVEGNEIEEVETFTMGVDWSHTPETNMNYHQAGSNIEPTRKKKKRMSKEHVENGSPDRH